MANFTVRTLTVNPSRSTRIEQFSLSTSQYSEWTIGTLNDATCSPSKVHLKATNPSRDLVLLPS